ncbi:MAG: sulfoxide reductase heme-binding subunit YedZ [Acidobacteria bacterium]|jgi:methionine sulfoxide reductase heme-binding subunit|nr:sulfoxide reductase heme-binding subunit YedZ [Acidobacteriota bacterium]
MSLMTRGLEPAVAAVCVVPLVLLAYKAYSGDLGVNPIETLTHETGGTALKLLVASLAVTPVRRLTGWNRLVSTRRLLGIFAFFYAVLHFSIYLVFDQFFDVMAIVDDVLKRKFILSGMVAFLAMLPLALTSTNGWIRRLGRRWQTLHRLAYLAGAAAAIHFVWKTKVPEVEPYAYAGVVAVLLLTRVWFSWKKRQTQTA